jgi:hypothetical protein
MSNLSFSCGSVSNNWNKNIYKKNRLENFINKKINYI